MGEHVDPAVREIEAAYAAGELVIVAGPAVPEAAGLPSRVEVLERLVERARRRRAGAGEEIEELVGLVDKRDLPAAFSAAKALLGPEYADEIEKALGGAERPVPPVARAVAALGPRLSAVLTVNLDRLLERAFQGEWPMFDRAVDDLGQRRGFILKLHGTVERRAGWILTTEEHERSIYADPRHQATVEALFRTHRRQGLAVSRRRRTAPARRSGGGASAPAGFHT